MTNEELLNVYNGLSLSDLMYTPGTAPSGAAYQTIGGDISYGDIYQMLYPQMQPSAAYDPNSFFTREQWQQLNQVDANLRVLNPLDPVSQDPYFGFDPGTGSAAAGGGYYFDGLTGGYKGTGVYSHFLENGLYNQKVADFLVQNGAVGADGLPKTTFGDGSAVYINPDKWAEAQKLMTPYPDMPDSGLGGWGSLLGLGIGLITGNPIIGGMFAGGLSSGTMEGLLKGAGTAYIGQQAADFLGFGGEAAGGSTTGNMMDGIDDVGQLGYSNTGGYVWTPPTESIMGPSPTFDDLLNQGGTTSGFNQNGINGFDLSDPTNGLDLPYEVSMPPSNTGNFTTGHDSWTDLLNANHPVATTGTGGLDTLVENVVNSGGNYVDPFSAGTITGVTGLPQLTPGQLGQINAITGLDTTGLTPLPPAPTGQGINTGIDSWQDQLNANANAMTGPSWLDKLKAMDPNKLMSIGKGIAGLLGAGAPQTGGGGMGGGGGGSWGLGVKAPQLGLLAVPQARYTSLFEPQRLGGMYDWQRGY